MDKSTAHCQEVQKPNICSSMALHPAQQSLPRGAAWPLTPYCRTQSRPHTAEEPSTTVAAHKILHVEPVNLNHADTDAHVNNLG